MPSVPIEMPSDTPIVLNRMPTSPGSLHAFLHLGGQVQQVHVAGVAFVPNARDADLRLLHVVVGHPRAVEHRLRGTLRLGLGNVAAVFVEHVFIEHWGHGKRSLYICMIDDAKAEEKRPL